MIASIANGAVQLVEGLGGIVGIRVGTEEPHYVAEPLTNRVEIRRYGPRIAAETTVFADDEAARSTGFRRLAGYIFGKNQQHTKIAMTAPVAQSSGAGGGSAIRFFMPSKWSLQTLPQPDADDVSLVEVPAETLAVLRFSGDRGPDAISSRTSELLQALQDNGLETKGEVVAWFYDPPWTIPWRRRNEVAVPIGA